MTLNASAENGASSDRRRARSRRSVFGSMPVDRRHVERARQVVDDRVEQRLDALVLEGGAEQHRRDLVGERAGAQRALDLVGGDRALVVEVGLEHLVVEVRDRVDQLVVVLVRLLGELGRDLGRSRTSGRGRPCRRSPASRRGRSTPAEVLLLADRELHRHRVRAEAVAHRLHGGEEVRAGAVHLVDERDARNLVLVGLAPDRLGLRLDAGDRVEDGDRAVEHAQAALDLDSEVHVPGRINNVDAMVAPRTPSSQRT